MAEENKGIYFTELTLENVRCFGRKAILKLSNDKGEWSRWNVILGDNGTGKTTLLQCLASFAEISTESKYYGDIVGFRSDIISNKYRIGNTCAGKIGAYIFDEMSNNLDHIYQSIDYYFRNESLGRVSTHAHYGGPVKIWKETFISGYGANRRIEISAALESKTYQEKNATLFDTDAKLINTEEWLLQMDYAASRDSDFRLQAIKRKELIIESLKKILPDIKDIDLHPPVHGQLIPRIQFLTDFGWVSIHQLSYGYKTMVAWVVDVAARMFERYPDSDNPLNEPVVILVDEIDLHLHPKWQRQIFDFLETRFPRAQFIVTAHSPLIVQSAPKDANIIVLKKEQIGDEFVVKIDNDKNTVWNWRIDQIMASDLFGLDTSRSPEIERQMDERALLLKKDPKSLSEEEKERLDELNEISYSLPTASDPDDIEAMKIIREAAAYLKNKQKAHDQDQK